MSATKNNDWYIIYRNKSICEYLYGILQKLNTPYYSTASVIEESDEQDLIKKDYESIKRLIFIQPAESATQFINKLKSEFGVTVTPYKDCMTGEIAKVGDTEMQRFIKLSRNDPDSIEILKDCFNKFSDRPRVRVKAGPYEGLEGHLVRIRRDRKVVISLGVNAISISGIHFSLLELIK